jgi:hypothetical protein
VLLKPIHFSGDKNKKMSKNRQKIYYYLLFIPLPDQIASPKQHRFVPWRATCRKFLAFWAEHQDASGYSGK